MIFNPMYSPNMPLNRMAGYARREAHFAQRNRFRTVGLHKEAERLEKAHHKEEALEALLHITYDLLETGNRYFGWYYHSLNLVEGQNVVITIDRWDDWKTISNLRNGKEQRVRKVVRVD